MTAPSAPPRGLAEEPFLRGLDPEFLRTIEPETSERRYAPNVMIAREGEPAEEFFLVLEGKVAFEVGTHYRDPLTVLTLGPGEVFGWSWLAPPFRWRMDVRTIKPTRVLRLPSAPLLRALDAHPAAAYQFLRRLVPAIAQRLDATWLQVLDVHRP